jgi:hypothetical protein
VQQVFAAQHSGEQFRVFALLFALRRMNAGRVEAGVAAVRHLAGFGQVGDGPQGGLRMLIEAREVDLCQFPIDAIVMGRIRSSNPLAVFFPEHLELLGCCYFHGQLGPKEDCLQQLLGVLDSHGNPPVIDLPVRQAVLCHRRVASAGPWDASESAGGSR